MQKSNESAGKQQQHDVSYMDRMDKEKSTNKNMEQGDEENRVNEDTGVIARKSTNNDGAAMNPMDKQERVQEQGAKQQHGKQSEGNSWNDKKGKGKEGSQGAGAGGEKSQRGNQSNNGGSYNERRSGL